MPQSIGVVMSARLATLHELETVLGTQDLYDMLEVLSIDGHNQRQAQEAAAKQRQG